MVKKKKESLITFFFDIETMPNLVRTWRKWEQDVVWYERHGYLWSISYKYSGDSRVYHKNITDFPLYKKDKFSDKSLTEFIWNLVNNVDIVVAHNGNAFDLKTITGRFVHWKLPPPKPYKKIDTKILYKAYLNEDSNSLKDIAEKHGLPLKLDTGGYSLWKGCENGVKKDIEMMKRYNNGDVVTLEAAYNFILPYITNHPNLALMSGKRSACPNCGSEAVSKQGVRYSRTSVFQQWKCTKCFSWHQSPLKANSQIR